MKDYLIPSNAPLWQPLLAYAVTFAVLCYLAYDRWRAGKHGWTIGLRIEVYGPRVPPNERTARPMQGEDDAAIGRI